MQNSGVQIYLSPPADFSPSGEAAGCFIEVGPDLLYLKRAPSRPMPNTWGIPGGKLEPGETPRQAVIREVQEETGIDIDALELQFIGTLYIVRTDWSYPFHLFALSFSEKPLVTINTEHTDIRWISAENATSLHLIPGGLETIQYYLSQRRPYGR